MLLGTETSHHGFSRPLLEIDMTQAAVAATPKNIFTSADPITAGFIARQMFVWETKIAQEIATGFAEAYKQGISELDHHMALPADSWGAKHADIPMDWMSGGLFILAEAIAFAIENSPMVWDDGVFVYTHCEDDERSVWKPIVEKMTAEQWQDLCGNNLAPSWIESEVLAVMERLGLFNNK